MLRDVMCWSWESLNNVYLRKIIGTFCRCLILAAILSRAVFAQVAKQTGFSFTGIPSANYNSDEETGYGVNGALYNHSTGEYKPYFWAVESEIYQTTRGPSSYFIFFDSLYIIVNLGSTALPSAEPITSFAWNRLILYSQ